MRPSSETGTYTLPVAGCFSIPGFLEGRGRRWGPLGLVGGALEAVWAAPGTLGVPWARGTSSSTRREQRQRAFVSAAPRHASTGSWRSNA
eukprot:6196858-Pyramimonas_sp.AAC.1